MTIPFKSRPLSSRQILDTLNELRQEAASFAEREQSFSKEARSRRFAVQRRSETTDEAHQAEIDTALRDLQTRYSERAETVQDRFEQRRLRIERLANTSRRNLPRRVEEERSRHIGRLQWRKRKAEARHQTAWKQFDTLAEGWSQELEEQEGQFALLMKRCRIAFGVLGPLRRLVDRSVATASEAVVVPPNAAARAARHKQVEEQMKVAEVALKEHLALPLPKLFRQIPFPAWLLAALVIGGIVVALYPHGELLYLGVGTAVGIALFGWALASLAAAQGRDTTVRTLAALQNLPALFPALKQSLDEQRAKEKNKLDEQLQSELKEVQVEWDQIDSIGERFEERARKKLEVQPGRLLERLERMRQDRVAKIESALVAAAELKTMEIDGRFDGGAAMTQQEMVKIEKDERERMEMLAAVWSAEVVPRYERLATLCLSSDSSPRAWTVDSAEAWRPPQSFPQSVRVGELSIDLATGERSLPIHENLQLPGPPKLQLPLALTFPQSGSLLIETNDSCSSAEADILNQVVLNILEASPAGKAAFTILDPVGLGQNFAGLMHLADYEEHLINRRIWTQRDQIDERLAEINEHIEKVIQMYLRNEYETITEFNEQAGSVAEKYHFLVVADFPANFSETAAQRLQSIAVSGPRCGVFTLMHWNSRQPVPEGFIPEELRSKSLYLKRLGNHFQVDSNLAAVGAVVTLDPAPGAETALALVHRIGKASVDSNRVEVPFSQIAPAPDALWMETTTHELRVPIGRTGATKLQYLAIGKGTRQHALFAGKTGSGKSTLFHVIITNLALQCSPDEVEFYLIDFKKGVEFKCYAENLLPHARVVAIESDREFGLSVLQRVDEELRRRGDLFRAIGVQDLAGYKKAGGGEPMPRSLLIIDEFQEFFVEDDTVAQNASVLFDRIVRQGRAFGIHVLLGSQTLGGAYTLARATLGQMVIRVALQCNEADAYLIMDENNSAPRLLSRPGEGIYNDAAGAVEGNSPFQVVWLNDDEREGYLRRIRELASERHAEREPPIVFEGNAPADAQANTQLARVLARPAQQTYPMPVVWLGAPNAIKGPTEAVFQRQSGNHLLIVGQREEATTSLLSLALIALAAQHPAGGAKFYFFHSAAPGTHDAVYLENLFSLIPDRVTVVKTGDIATVMAELDAELQRRSAAETNDAPPTFVLVHGLHKFKKLRQEDDFAFSMADDESSSAGAQFRSLITEGSGYGIHLIVSLDTYNNVSRCISRKSLTEFEMRVIFQMSANDSASLIESAKGSDLGLHRAIFYDEQLGVTETFRPYALPDGEWLKKALAGLA